MVNDYIPPKSEPIFPGATQVKVSEALIGKTIVLKEFKEMMGDKGEFLVVLATLDDKPISFATSSKALVKAIHAMTLPTRAKIIEVKSKEGRMYQNFDKP